MIEGPDVQAGWLKTYIQNWQVITQDPWMLDVVSGRPIDWVETPKQNLVPKELKFNQETSLKVDDSGANQDTDRLPR